MGMLATKCCESVFEASSAIWGRGDHVSPAEKDIEPVTEVRDMALQDLEAEAQAVADEARAVVEDVKGIARDPLGAVMPGIMGAAAKAALKSVKNKS